MTICGLFMTLLTLVGSIVCLLAFSRMCNSSVAVSILFFPLEFSAFCHPLEVSAKNKIKCANKSVVRICLD